ncbi:hypothetical protein C8R46DRAFT_1235676 [Mycena filopes]|nr:hypothetical protein C8R46DRAFT_1235676 [Mycena filopes]
MSTRTSAHNISKSIATLAAQDLVTSDDEIMNDPDADQDTTLVSRDRDDQDQEEDSGSDSSSDSSDDDEAPNSGTVRKRTAGASNADEDKEEDESDDEAVVGKKRKRSRNSSEEPPPARDIEYQVLIYTPNQMKQKKSARGAPVTEIFSLAADEPWPELKIHILAEINDTLKPRTLLLSNYALTFTIPRHVTTPIQLTDTKYDYLVKKALLIAKNPTEFDGEKENEEDTAPKRKPKVPKARDILPANVALNEKIGELRERWICPTPRGPCGSAHCFFTAIKPEHFPLSHDHFQSWGAAMLKGTAFADLEVPPNNNLFDAIAAGARGAQSPLLQRRLELREREAAKNAPAAPQVNFNFPPEFAAFLRQPAPIPAPAPAPALPLAAPNALTLPPNTGNMLIPYPCIPGPDLTITNFCTTYNLDDDIRNRFESNKYKGSADFEFIEVDELKEMGFMRGEIAQIKGAIGKWSQLA